MIRNKIVSRAIACLFLLSAGQARSDALIQISLDGSAWKDHEIRIDGYPVGHVGDWVEVKSDVVAASISWKDRWFEPSLLLNIEIRGLAGGKVTASVKVEGGTCARSRYEIIKPAMITLKELGA